MADPYGKPSLQGGYRLNNASFLNLIFQKVLQGGLSRKSTITAKAGGTQAAAVQLTSTLNKITVCATAGDSVAAPKAVAGSVVIVENQGAQSLNVFPKVGSGDTINAAATTVAYAVAAGKTAQLICNDVGKYTGVTFP